MRKSRYISNEFVRLGGINAVNQKYERNILIAAEYHYPPFGRGIYACPIKAVESFLIPWGDPKRKDEHMRHFKYTGDLWHHLGEYCKHSEILATKNAWVLTSFKTWQKAFTKCSLNDRTKTMCDRKYEAANGRTNVKYIPFSEIRSGVSGIYSKDHYEVFIPNMK